MAIDEILRSFSYAGLIAAIAFIGVRVWNAAMMPDMLRRPVAVILWLQASIYLLIMVGLLLLRFHHAIPPLVYLNTALIFGQAVTAWYVVLRLLGRRAIHAVMVVIFLFALFLI